MLLNTTKFGKRPALDCCRLERSWGKRVSNANRTKCKPYEKGQYLLECKHKMGWSEPDALTQWNEMEASNEIDRVMGGFMSAFVCGFQRK